jgi:hypothetical protein
MNKWGSGVVFLTRIRRMERYHTFLHLLGFVSLDGEEALNNGVVRFF